MAQPPRIAVSLGSTTRLTEFDFSKISVSLERDLVPAENTIDAYRDIKALLERMVSEFQGSKPAGTSTPAGNGNRGVPPRPAASKLAVLQERLGARLQDLELMEGMDGLMVKPRRYLEDAWAEINEVVRSLGGHWQKGQTSKDGSWRIPK